MNIDTSLQSSAATQSASSTAAALTGTGKTAAEQQESFLKMLITQLKNQDPLNPMDNAQITSQMAQLSTLQGIDKLNSTLSSLATNLTGNQTMQAASLVGHDVMAPGSQLQLAGGNATAGVELASAADKVVVTITNSGGTVVHRVDLGAQPQGIVQLNWDGTTDSGAAAAAGTYQFSVSATAQGKSVDATALMLGRVQGVTAGQSGTNLDLGSLGSVGLTQVKQFY